VHEDRAQGADRQPGTIEGARLTVWSPGAGRDPGEGNPVPRRPRKGSARVLQDWEGIRSPRVSSLKHQFVRRVEWAAAVSGALGVAWPLKAAMRFRAVGAFLESSARLPGSCESDVGGEGAGRSLRALRPGPPGPTLAPEAHWCKMPFDYRIGAASSQCFGWAAGRGNGPARPLPLLEER
jgi:hypothetical protein